MEEEFIVKTYKRVLLEDGDLTFYGLPEMKNVIDCKSIVFEFAFDQIECKTVKQINDITKTFEEIFDSIKTSFMKVNLPVSKIVYNSIPDIYKPEEEIESDIRDIFL